MKWVNFCLSKSLISHMCFVCFGFCLLSSQLESVENSIDEVLSIFKAEGPIPASLPKLSNDLPSWGCRIHRLHLCSGVRLTPTSVQDMTLNNLMVRLLELWGMQSTPSLPSHPGPLCLRVVTPDRVLSMGQIELNCNDAELNCLKLTDFAFNCVKERTILIQNWIVWNRTVYMYKMDLALNYQPCLIFQ